MRHFFQAVVEANLHVPAGHLKAGPHPAQFGGARPIVAFSVIPALLNLLPLDVLNPIS